MMINIGDNILKELDFNKNSGTNSLKSTKGNFKSNSFNSILDKNIQNKKNDKIYKFSKEKSGETDSEIDSEINNEIKDVLQSDNYEQCKLPKKKVEDILESILLMLNFNDTAKPLMKNGDELKEGFINIEDIAEDDENIDIDSLKEMILKVLEKYISPEIVQRDNRENFQEQGTNSFMEGNSKEILKDVNLKNVNKDIDIMQEQQFFKDNNLLQGKTKETLKDIVFEVIDKYTSGLENHKENVSTKDDKTLEMLKKVIAESIEKNLHSENYNEEKNIIFKVKDGNDFTVGSNLKKNENFSNVFNLKSKESSFLENLTKDQSKDENFPIDKINFHLNKMNDLSKIGNKIEFNNVNKTELVNKQTFDFDLVKSIKYMNLNNMKELTLKVVPRELGELLIKVSMDNGVLKASITSNTKEAYQLLQNNTKSILEKLQSESIRVEEFSVDIYDQNNTSSNKENFKDRRDEYDGTSRNNLKEVINSDEEEENANIILDEVLNMLA